MNAHSDGDISRNLQIRRPLGIPVAWWVTLGTSFGVGLGYTAITSTFLGQFVPIWSESFSLSRARIALVLTIMSYTVAVTAVISGMLVDRFGPGRVLVWSQIALGMAFSLLITMNGSVTSLYVIGFFIAVVGSGTLPATYTRILLTWFDQKRGTAFGLTLAGFGISAAVAPPVIQWALGQFGWKPAVLGLAILISCVGGLNALWLAKTKLEGSLEIDGGCRGSGKSIDKVDSGSILYRQLLRYPEIYVLSLAFFLLGIVTMGIVFNLPTILVDGGLSGLDMGLAMGAFGITFTVARPVVGCLLDHMATTYVTAGMLFSGLLGIISLFGESGFWFTCLGLIILALGFGAEHDIKAFVISKIFPRGGYARVYSTAYSSYVLGVGLGPPILAYSNDRLGTYDPVLWIFTAVFAVGGGFLLWVSRRADAVGRLLVIQKGETCNRDFSST